MSLFGDIAGQVLGGMLGGNAQQQGGNPLIQIAAQLLQQQGGIEGLLAKLQSSGLGEQAASWVGTGENQAVDGGQLAGALGNDTISDLASKFGMSSEQISGGLAQMLPQLIDKVTPNGSTQGADDLLQQGLSVLTGMLGQKA